MRRVKIQNFQSLAEVELELGRFTVLVGPSSTGKSAVLRALRLVFRNSSGTGYVRTGSTGTVVEVSADDPTWSVEVARGVKGRSNNFVLSHHGDPAEFAKCGTSVPEPVAKFLNVGDESLSTQHDAPYLLSATGSEVAQLFGELTGADVLQKAAVNGQTAARNAKQDVAVATASVDQATEGLSNLPDEVALEARVSDAERIVRAAEAAEGLRTLCEKLVLAQTRAAGTHRDEPPAADQINQLWEHRQRIANLVESRSKAQNRVFSAEQKSEQFQLSLSDSESDLMALFAEADVCDHCPLRV